MFWSTDDEHLNEIYNEEELAEMVFNSIKWYKDQNDALIQRNKELRENAKKVVSAEYEATIEQLKERLSMSYGEFSSQKEKEAYNQFEKEHMHDRRTSRYNGGRAPYLIPIGTGIGTHLEVVCPICGEKKDITDTEVW